MKGIKRGKCHVVMLFHCETYFSYSSLAFETFATVSLIGTHNCFHRSGRCDRFSACMIRAA